MISAFGVTHTVVSKSSQNAAVKTARMVSHHNVLTAREATKSSNLLLTPRPIPTTKSGFRAHVKNFSDGSAKNLAAENAGSYRKLAVKVKSEGNTSNYQHYKDQARASLLDSKANRGRKTAHAAKMKQLQSNTDNILAKLRGMGKAQVERDVWKVKIPKQHNIPGQR